MEQQPNEPEKTKLEQVEGILNKKDDRYFFRRRRGLGHTETATHDDWHDQLPEDTAPVKQTHTFGKIVFLTSALFFVGALAFAFYTSQGGHNVISNQNVEVTITGPLGVKAGDEIQLQLQIVNNNDVPLEVSDITITYPPGTRLASNPSKETTRVVNNLGDIAPHQVINDTLRVVLFGEEKSDQEIKAELEYHLPNSGTIYVKEVSYHVVIDAAPVAIQVTSPDAVTSGDEVTLEVNVLSNTGKLIPGLLLKVNYPPGFAFTRATPAPQTGTTNLWALGDLSASSSRSILITGVMTGQDNDTKAFQIIAGTGTAGSTKDVTLVYNSLFQKVTLSKPFLGLSVTLDGGTTDPAIAEGTAPVRALLSWANNTDMTLTDCALQTKFNGALDQRSVKIDTAGNYFSSTNTVIWNANSLDAFKILNPNDSSAQTIIFNSAPLVSGATTVKKPSINLDSVLSCTRVGDTAHKDSTLTTRVTRAVRVASNVQFSASARYYTGPFTNTGPFPPKGDEDTTFTVIWSLTNTSNDITSSQIKAVLPPYATWSNNSLGDGTISYDPNSRIVTWAVGTLKAGVGYESPVKQISFQVSIKPPVTAEGSFAQIIGPATFTGVDDFTKTTRQGIKEALTSELKSDPGLPRDLSGKVQ